MMNKCIFAIGAFLLSNITNAAFVTIVINNQTPLTLNCTVDTQISNGSLVFSADAKSLSPGASTPNNKIDGIVAESSPSAKKAKGTFSCVSVGNHPSTIGHVNYEQTLPALGLGKVDLSVKVITDNQLYKIDKKIAPANTFVGNDADYENNLELIIKPITP